VYSITINLNEKEECFLLTGDTDAVLSNNRLMFSLKRLGHDKHNKDLIIPYPQNEKIQFLQKLQKLLKKFSFIEEKSQETQDSLDSFYHEQETFKIFSEKANTIRNYKIDDLRQDKDFADFSQVVTREFTKREPKDFQWLSAFHMAFSQKSCNFSVPGAGKTTIVYAVYAYLKNILNVDKKVDRLVVIGPKSSFVPWESEYEKCFGKKITSQRISGEVPMAERKQHLASGDPAELTLISFHSVPSLKNEIEDFIKNNNVMLVVDEAHRIKKINGKNAISILEVGKGAKSRVILTGTPLPNGYQDIYNLYKFIYPYHYKDILKFHYANLEDMTQKQELDSDRVGELIDNISPFFIRVKKDTLGLPPVHEEIIKVTMDKHQREIYDFIEEQYVDSFKNDDSATIKDILNKAKLIRLRQASTNPTLLLQPIIDNLDENDENTGKLSDNEKIADIDIFKEISKYQNITPNKFIAIKDLLQEKIIPQQQKVIIWTIFIKNAEQLKQYLQLNNIKSELLLGYVAQDKREEIINSFNNPNDLNFQVVIANPFTVAESISLHKGCHNAIYMERDYNCGNFLQSKDRIHRVGLDPEQKTYYYYFLSENSIDEVINQKLDEKAERMAKVIDGDIPLLSILDDDNETDLIQALIRSYDKRNN
jgi:SNF2 family DNA or RNA helicase